VRFGDMLLIDCDGKGEALAFYREGQGAVIPAPMRRPMRATPMRVATGAASEVSENTNVRELEPVLMR